MKSWNGHHFSHGPSSGSRGTVGCQPRNDPEERSRKTYWKAGILRLSNQLFPRS